MESNDSDPEWDDVVDIVVEWILSSPDMIDVSFASWLDTNGCKLLFCYKVPIS